jgi:hypothetical protein
VLTAGGAYFLTVFAAGFVLGTVRVLWVAPNLGPVPAVLIELPMLLTFAWFVCGWILRRWKIGRAGGADIGMGLTAFMLLILAETAFSVLLTGQSLSVFFQRMATAQGAIGLAGQILFAALPAIRSRISAQ